MRYLYLNPGEVSKEWTEHYKKLRLEQNIMLVRRKAIWAGRDPNLAEKNYLAAVDRRQKCNENPSTPRSITSLKRRESSRGNASVREPQAG